MNLHTMYNNLKYNGKKLTVTTLQMEVDLDIIQK